VNRVVPADALAAETDRIALRLAAGAPAALANLKRLMRASFDHTFAEQLDAEREAFLRCAATADFREGMAAFAEKRPARYEGR
jgi:2-(1,2-epoxy-1,2-dihydrophenyl)acetyl-CoA isomerase